MKDKLMLTIAVTSLISLNAAATPRQDGAAPAAPGVTAHGGGKCASGKCGTEKIYSKAKVEHDPNGKLVHARDGKCGLSGKGYAVAQSDRDKLAQGVCGQ